MHLHHPNNTVVLLNNYWNLGGKHTLDVNDFEIQNNDINEFDFEDLNDLNTDTLNEVELMLNDNFQLIKVIIDNQVLNDNYLKGSIVEQQCNFSILT